MPAALLTERLSLEPWEPGYGALLVALSSDPEVVRYIGHRTPWTPARAAEMSERNTLHWSEHGFGWRVAVHRETDRAVGFVALSFAGEGAGIGADEHEIGWWLQPAVWRQGLAREGAIAIRDEAFQRLGAPSVVARVAPDNDASLGVARAIGLTREADGRGRFGEPITVLRLTAADWSALVGDAR